MESSTDTTPPQAITNENVHLMLTACQQGDIPTIQRLATINKLYCCQQDNETGLSPLMIASQSKINNGNGKGKQGNLELVQFLLQEGNAPWNAVCRLKNKCAGDYATDSENWDIVNLLVDWGTRAELILGTLHKQLLSKQQQESGVQDQEVENDRQKQNLVIVII